MNDTGVKMNWRGALVALLILAFAVTACDSGGKPTVAPTSTTVASAAPSPTTAVAAAPTNTTVAATPPTNTNATSMSGTSGTVAATATTVSTGSTGSSGSGGVINPSAAATPATINLAAPTPVPNNAVELKAGAAVSAAMYTSNHISATLQYSGTLDQGAINGYNFDATQYKNGGLIQLELKTPADTGNSSDYTASVDDANGNNLARISAGPGGDKTDEETFKAGGVFSITVKSDSGYNTTDKYTLNFRIVGNADNYDNASALPITAPAIISSAIASSSDVNMFKLDLSQYANGGTVSLDLTSPTKSNGSDISVKLLDPSGGNADSLSVPEGKIEKSDQVTVKQGGVYFVEAYADSGYNPDDPYLLKVGFTANAGSTSTALATIPAAGTIKDTLNSSTDVRLYDLDMSAYPAGGLLDIKFTTPQDTNGSDMTWTLLDPDGTTEIESVSVGAAANKDYNTSIKKGDKYHLRVKADSGYNNSDPFTLSVNLTPNETKYNSADSAYPLVGPATIKATSNSDTDQQWCSVQLNAGATITTSLTNPYQSRTLIVDIVGSDKTTAIDSYRVGGASKKENIVDQLPQAGTYYLHVYSDSNSGTDSNKPYTLVVTFGPAAGQ